MVNLVIIGNGKPFHIEGFRKNTGYSGQVYTNPDLSFYNFFEFKRSATSIFGMKAMATSFKAISNGRFQKGVKGDALQIGGMVLVDSSSNIRFLFQSKEAGHHYPADEIPKMIKDSLSLD